ncbi:MAG: hypothetical protein JWO91_571 [Acidobacteriaceae bacterium]|nr:hypothetical protein [Acidobacteriaceae bacterium]
MKYVASERLNDPFANDDLNVVIADGSRSEVRRHNRGSAGTFDALVIEGNLATGRGGLGFGQPAASEEAEQVENLKFTF